MKTIPLLLAGIFLAGCAAKPKRDAYGHIFNYNTDAATARAQNNRAPGGVVSSAPYVADTADWQLRQLQQERNDLLRESNQIQAKRESREYMESLGLYR